METAQLCKCLNCEVVLIDENPQTSTPELSIPNNVLEMVQLKEDDGSFFWACPICKDDGALIDVNPFV